MTSRTNPRRLKIFRFLRLLLGPAVKSSQLALKDIKAWPEQLCTELAAYILTTNATQFTIRQLIKVVEKIVDEEEKPDHENDEDDEGTAFFYFLGRT